MRRRTLRPPLAGPAAVAVSPPAPRRAGRYAPQTNLHSLPFPSLPFHSIPFPSAPARSFETLARVFRLHAVPRSIRAPPSRRAPPRPVATYSPGGAH
eukprot:6145118-Pyramimonas_sp.AAC.2